MAHQRRTGIVVKTSRNSHKIALLDQKAGRVDAIVHVPVHVGSLLEYNIDREQGNFLYITDLSITDLPFSLGRDDIHFWHHVLELVYYFVQVGTPVYQLFDFLLILYSIQDISDWSRQSKKIYLFKLLTAIGLYTELPPLPQADLYHLLETPVDQIAHITIDDARELVLNTWLRACVAQHPAITQFKTVYFLFYSATK